MQFFKQKRGVGSNDMQKLVERQLLSLHDQSSESVSRYKEKVAAFLVGVFVLVLLPYLHIGVYHLKIWVPDKKPVAMNNCTCSCFDTVFRGAYEEPGTTRYKHVYFNATWQTHRIWIFTVVFIILGYESIKYLVPLFRRRKIRRTMLLLYLVNLYPHYYSWWSYFSYYNEGFYRYLWHHLWFTVTEIFTTCIVLNLCDKRNEIMSWKVLVIASINTMHILVGGMDQFITDVIYGKGAMFHKARNIGLMIPDVMHVVIPLWELYNYAKKRDLKMHEICYKEEMFMCIVLITLGTLIGRLL